MPELPEVETLRRGLGRHLTGRAITAVRVSVPKILRGTVQDPAVLEERLRGVRVTSIGRRGKHLIFSLDSGYYLLLHLKMRGQLTVVDRDEPDAPYLAAAFALDDGQEFRFHDIWRWGEIRFVSAGELETHPGIAGMGPEPLDDGWTAEALRRNLSRRARTALKAALLDQAVVAGVGNIYADESLFRSRLAPQRPAGSLTEEEAVRLYGAIRAVLTEAIGGGGTASDNYVDADGAVGRYAPQVYDRGGQPCPACGGPLVKTRIGGRGTTYCPRCQS